MSGALVIGEIMVRDSARWSCWAAVVLMVTACDAGGGGGGGPALTPLPQLPTYKTEVRSASSEVRGKELFRVQGCIMCHGEAGKGGVKNPNSDTGGKINGLTLVKEGYTPDKLAKKINEGALHVGRNGKRGPVPPLRMPAYGLWLSNAEINDLSAYLLSLFPKGRKVKDDWDDADDEDSDDKDSDDKESDDKDERSEDGR